MYIYKVTTYYYSTYSYSGIEPVGEFYFIQPKLAKDFIEREGLKLVQYAEESNHATLDEIEVVEN